MPTSRRNPAISRILIVLAAVAVGTTVLVAPAASADSPGASLAGSRTSLAGSSPAAPLELAASATTLTVDSTATLVGKPVQATVSVTGADPTGTITISQDTVEGNPVTLENGSATFLFDAPTAGIHTLTATYHGDDNNGPSTSEPVVVTVKMQAQATISAPVTSVWGNDVTVTGSVIAGSVAAEGSVRIQRAGSDIALAQLRPDGSYLATVPAAALSIGDGQLGVVYDGDATSTSASATQDFAVTARPSMTTVSFEPAAISYGKAVTATVRVTAAGPVPTGFVTLSGAAAGTAPLTDGVAVFQLPIALTPATYSATADYTGDTWTAPSSADGTFAVAKLGATITATPSAASYGTAGSIRLAVTGGQPLPSGSVVVTADGVAVGHATLTPTGAVVVLPASWKPGAHTVQLAYSGDLIHLPATGSAVMTVNRAATWIAASAVNAAYGLGSQVQVAVHGAGSVPVGVVAVYEGASLLAHAALSNGSVRLPLPKGLPVGTHLLAVRYFGSGLHLPGAGSVRVTVTPGASTVRATAAASGYGVPASVKITVSGALSRPTGTARVYSGAILLAAVNLTAGTATAALPRNLGVGVHLLTVRYSGSRTHRASSAVFRLIITKGATKLIATSSAPTYPGQARVSVRLTAGPAAPTGRITVRRIGTGSWTTTLRSGTGSILLPKIAPGLYRFTVDYSGDVRYVGRSVTVLVRVVAPTARPAPYYQNCTDVWNHIGRPIYRSDPGFRAAFDRDGDGIGCETRPR